MRRKAPASAPASPAPAPGRSRLSPILLPLALFVLILFLGWRFLARGGDQPPAESPPVTQVTVVCSEECANRGQCGQTADGRAVVLGHPDQPAVRDHQLIFTADTAAALVATNDQTVQIVTTGAQFNQTFYLLTRPEDGRSAWVAGWCVIP